MRFFTPTPRFTDWLKAQAVATGKPVIDCGCGDGDLVREMLALGVRCLGIDSKYSITDERVPSDLCACVFPAEAQHMPLVSSMPAILLVCRPSHSGFPAEINRVRCPDSDFYYVGFQKNIRDDLGDASVKKVLDGPVGDEGEHLWRVSPPTRRALARRPMLSHATLSLAFSDVR